MEREADDCPQCSACAACDGGCGVCPYADQTKHHHQRAPQPWPDEVCRVVEVDGEPIRVHGAREMTATERETFAAVVRAAKDHFELINGPQRVEAPDAD